MVDFIKNLDFDDFSIALVVRVKHCRNAAQRKYLEFVFLFIKFTTFIDDFLFFIIKNDIINDLSETIETNEFKSGVVILSLFTNNL